MDRLSNTHLAEKIQIPAWVFNVRECRISWANQLGVRHWNAKSLDDLTSRNLADDMSDAVRKRLHQYLHDCVRYEKTLTDEWTLYPSGRPQTMRLAFCSCDDFGQRDSLFVQVLDEDIAAVPGALHGMQALLHTSTLISIFNADFDLIYANPAARSIFSGPNISLGEYIADANELRRIVESLMDGKRIEPELAVNTNNGDCWHSMSIQKCPDPGNGEPTYLISATDVTEERAAKLELRKYAYTDSLTGLMNRHAMVEYIEQRISKQDKTQFSVVFVDVNRFKFINDSYGHQTGDLLLRSFAKMLQNTFGENGKISRLSGDEFCAIVDSACLSKLSSLVCKIQQLLERPVVVDGYHLRVNSNIGVSRYPYDASDAETLLQNADIAMHNGKDRTECVCFFDSEIGNACRQRLTIEAELINALESDQFVLHYQPKISADDFSVSGVEALVRWEHPERGMISPLDFIPVAEETGLIVDVGEWVLRKAVSDQVRWENHGYSVSVAVNVSPMQFNTQDFAGRVATTLNEFSCPAERLNIEVTESSLCGDERLVQNTLNLLCEQGVTISIDDFGTGYSNLANLHKFPIHCLKIDRAFVADFEQAALLLTILEMGKLMRLRVVAEGVETAEQVTWLAARQCDEFQGFYFSKPLPYQGLLEFLGSQKVSSSPQLAV